MHFSFCLRISVQTHDVTISVCFVAPTDAVRRAGGRGERGGSSRTAIGPHLDLGAGRGLPDLDTTRRCVWYIVGSHIGTS